jgi:aerobic-type carbon monoxide dehydrogenase small subunit (CoxS/CutS family)
MEKIRLIINGKSMTAEADAEMPLLWFLRDTLSMTGTKFGCGQGLCGACTVHVNGNPVRSCVTTLASIQGQRVTTIEGLSSDGSHPVQQAWLEEDVPQCGYCQAGQIMTASWLLSYRDNPNEEEIEQAMSGNLCRCGTYVRIRRAIARAVQIAKSRKAGSRS